MIGDEDEERWKFLRIPTGDLLVTEVEAEEFVQFIRDPSDVLVLFL